jgi:hypothetical protein
MTESGWLRVFENWALRRKCLHLRGRKLQGAGENCIMRRSIMCACHQILLLGWLAGHVARMGEMRNAYRLSIGKAQRKETNWDGRKVLKQNLEKYIVYCVEWIELALWWRDLCLVPCSLLPAQCQLCLHDASDPHPHGARGPKVVEDRDPEVGLQLHLTPRHPAAGRYKTLLRWDDNIKMDLREICNGRWMKLA